MLLLADVAEYSFTNAAQLSFCQCKDAYMCFNELGHYIEPIWQEVH